MSFKKWVLSNPDDSMDMEIVRQMVKHKDFPEEGSVGKITRYIVDNYGLHSKEFNSCKVIWRKYESQNDNGLKDQKKCSDDNIRMKRGEASKLLNCAGLMPPLIHNDPLQRFDPVKSEVSQWLIQQPDILQYVFTRAKNAGMIVYNHKSGKWIGVDYERKRYEEES